MNGATSEGSDLGPDMPQGHSRHARGEVQMMHLAPYWRSL